MTIYDRVREARTQAARSRYGTGTLPATVRVWIEGRPANSIRSDPDWNAVLDQLQEITEVILEADARGEARGREIERTASTCLCMYPGQCPTCQLRSDFARDSDYLP